jgi:hypothetical protein
VASKEVKQSVAIVMGISLLVANLVFMPIAGAVEYGNIGGHPAYPDPSNARSQSIFIHTVNPGDSAQDAVKVVNYTDKPKTLLIYATDSIVSSGGAFGCAQKVEAKPGVGSWIQLEKAEVTLAPQTDAIVPFTLQVPKDANVGETDGCIVIQEKDPAVQNVQQEGGKIQLTFRTAIRVAILVPGNIVKKLSIVGYTVSKSAAGNFILKPQVKNDGNVSIDSDVTTISSYLLGPHLSTHSQQFPILRGATADWNIELNRPFWGGWLKSKFTVSYDANVSNKIGDQANKNIVVHTSKQVIFFSPPRPSALLIELLILALLLAVALWLRSRLKRRRIIAKVWKDYTVRARDDIKSLAASHGTSWKLIVKTNKLKAPYSLKKGDKIKLPPKPKKP